MPPSSPLNILIPAAGLGTRFVNAGYTLPKPRVSVLGEPMLHHVLAHLRPHPHDTIYIAVEARSALRGRLECLLRRTFPHLHLRLILILGVTRGAADTLRCMLREIPPALRARKTLSLDCDVVYYSDVLALFRALPRAEGCCAYFRDDGRRPMYSYIDVEKASGRVRGIAEKVAISDCANTGAYGFASGEVLSEFLESWVPERRAEEGELYTSAVIGAMVRGGHVFRAVHVADFACVGTPGQLEAFLETARRRPPPRRNAVAVMDLETLPGFAGVAAMKKEVTEVLEGLEGVGVQAMLSLERGRKMAGRWRFASKEMRKAARREGRLFPMDGRMRKAVGW